MTDIRLDTVASHSGPAETWTYACFDFFLRSAIPLAELLPAQVEGDARPIVDVRLAVLPDRLPNALEATYGLQIADGTAMFTAPGVARYLIRDGREILVDPLPGASERNMHLFLLGSALGILCHQRGLLPLHANAIMVDGGAVAFAGRSGQGKSTLAAHFKRAGYEVLCDDVCVVSLDEAGFPLAWPGLPCLKLWGDAADAFGYDRLKLDPAIEGKDKYHVPLSPSKAHGPAPFRRLYVLAWSDETANAGIVPLRGREGMETVMSQTYRGLYLGPMGLAARHFRQCAALLKHAKVYEARRVFGYDVFEREARELERHVVGGH